MSPSAATPPISPYSHRPAPAQSPSFDGVYYSDELPPELYDEDEDREDLTTYLQIAESIRE